MCLFQCNVSQDGHVWTGLPSHQGWRRGRHTRQWLGAVNRREKQRVRLQLSRTSSIEESDRTSVQSRWKFSRTSFLHFCVENHHLSWYWVKFKNPKVFYSHHNTLLLSIVHRIVLSFTWTSHLLLIVYSRFLCCQWLQMAKAVSFFFVLNSVSISWQCCPVDRNRCLSLVGCYLFKECVQRFWKHERTVLIVLSHLLFGMT